MAVGFLFGNGGGESAHTQAPVSLLIEFSTRLAVLLYLLSPQDTLTAEPDLQASLITYLLFGEQSENPRPASAQYSFSAVVNSSDSADRGATPNSKAADNQVATATARM